MILFSVLFNEQHRVYKTQCENFPVPNPEEVTLTLPQVKKVSNWPVYTHLNVVRRSEISVHVFQEKMDMYVVAAFETIINN